MKIVISKQNFNKKQVHDYVFFLIQYELNRIFKKTLTNICLHDML